MGIYAQNTSKKGVRPNKQANRIYTWVYKCKTLARRELNPKKENRMVTWVYKRKTSNRRELNPKSKQIECIRGYTSVKHLQEGS